MTKSRFDTLSRIPAAAVKTLLFTHASAVDVRVPPRSWTAALTAAWTAALFWPVWNDVMPLTDDENAVTATRVLKAPTSRLSITALTKVRLSIQSLANSEAEPSIKNARSSCDTQVSGT